MQVPAARQVRDFLLFVHLCDEMFRLLNKISLIGLMKCISGKPFKAT